MSNPNPILSKVYELHRAELDRLKADYTRELNAKLEQINKQAGTIKVLRAFKNFVHRRLDTAGVPSEFPDGAHTKEGCRIGDRLDWLVERTVFALAAIKKAKVLLTRVDACHVLGQEDTDAAFESLRNVDLSLLHEHDAEVRKPLVDALFSVASCGALHRCACPAVAADALAKVKEQTNL